jgi:hypothetical protein
MTIRRILGYIGYKIKMPWYLRNLKTKGSKFVHEYSDDGDAQLIVSPRMEDKVAYIPIFDRPYEYAFTVEKFLEHNVRNRNILDIGSAGSTLPTILAALGNKVTCLDIRDWPVSYPNLSFIKGDIADLNLPYESFDVITCVSTIEHIGLGRYGDIEDPEGDIKAAEEPKKYLKPNGLLILTVPFGKPTVVFPAHRIYNRSRLQKIISGFRVVDEKFFGPIENPIIYRPCTEEEAYSVDTSKKYAVICCLLKKVMTLEH